MLKSLYILVISLTLITVSQAVPTKSTGESFWNSLNRTRPSPARRGCSTNAECLRTGQSLIKPHRRSPTTRALAPRQSAGFPRMYNAIRVTSTSGQEYGWVENFQTTSLQFSNDPTLAMSINYVENANAADPLTLTISSDQRPSGFPYLAAQPAVPADESQSDLRSGSFNYATLTAGSINHPAGPPYTGPEDTYYDSDDSNETNSQGTETAIVSGGYGSQLSSELEAELELTTLMCGQWVVNPDTLEITAQWINADGSKPPTAIVAYLRNNLLLLSGDGPIFKSTYGQYGEIMTLHFDTLPETP
ncbi:hypothetical protein I302_108792 [Kwoniella bestiolae CBS 10118]|uniref:Uncharacterized protein n=1 Tax=Kwoniella bestiolae CBS 10118 TaxID=1296100 RepID=A0A1B9FU32_9TREE|nr:hypothetical protein I302_07929 [Kwoniella bestiolae CBS 10118]OCF22284.1 hypothetical protein I302_07929 [Kwoniella bestiolae CBS 10118]